MNYKTNNAIAFVFGSAAFHIIADATRGILDLDSAFASAASWFLALLAIIIAIDSVRPYAPSPDGEKGK